MTKKQLTIRALLIEKEDGWVAQCLEYDIAAQANTLDELQGELERLLVSHVAISLEMGREPFEGFNQAPAKFWTLFQQSRMRLEADEDEPPPTSSDSPAILRKLKVTNQRALETV